MEIKHNRTPPTAKCIRCGITYCCARGLEQHSCNPPKVETGLAWP